MRTQFTIALRYLFGRKLRTVLTTLAITFGVLVLFGMNSVLPAMEPSRSARAGHSVNQMQPSLSKPGTFLNKASQIR
jgi:putative ABC transport system permease protein